MRDTLVRATPLRARQKPSRQQLIKAATITVLLRTNPERVYTTMMIPKTYARRATAPTNTSDRIPAHISWRRNRGVGRRKAHRDGTCRAVPDRSGAAEDAMF